MWNFSLGNVGATIADVLKARADADSQAKIAAANAAAANAQTASEQTLRVLNQGQVQFIVVALVVGVVAVALIRSKG